MSKGGDKLQKRRFWETLWEMGSGVRALNSRRRWISEGAHLALLWRSSLGAVRGKEGYLECSTNKECSVENTGSTSRGVVVGGYSGGGEKSPGCK